MYQLIRPFLFLFDPEAIHHFTFSMLRWVGKIPGSGLAMRAFFNRPGKGVDLFGLHFRNRVGLAAGFDKDAVLIDELANFGFGFIEIGTLTPLPQDGNPQPRLFRLPQDQAIINRMGFNNKGVLEAAERLKKRKSDVLVGGNIGKNKITDNSRAFEDYNYCMEALYPYVDYFVVNVSSPNTPNLRDLQEKEPLKKILLQVKKLMLAKAKPKPVLLKIAPDLTDTQLDDVIWILKETGTDGVIATNTTISRDALSAPAATLLQIGNGGVSGMPLRDRATAVIRYLRRGLGPDFPIIGVGGIMSPADALEKINAGADLIQLYTGFIYEGPAIVKKINRYLDRHNL